MKAMLREALVIAALLATPGAVSAQANDSPAASPAPTLLASLDAAVARSVKAETVQVKFEDGKSKPRPYLRNSLIGAAAGALVMGIIGAQIDHNEAGQPSVSGYTGAYALGGAAIGAGIGALTALIPTHGSRDTRP